MIEQLKCLSVYIKLYQKDNVYKQRLLTDELENMFDVAVIDYIQIWSYIC